MDAYITTICNDIRHRFSDLTLSNGVKEATCNLVQYYLSYSEAAGKPRHRFDSAALKQSFDFCTGPLPKDLNQADRKQLSFPGQRDYQEALKLVPILLKQAFEDMR